MTIQGTKGLLASGLFAGLVLAQYDCPSSVSATVPEPSVAPGYAARLVASGLRSPRGMVFDNNGRLLVVEQEHGVTALTFEDAGGPCLTVSNMESVIDDSDLNHGIAIEPDNSFLYASSAEAVNRYPYGDTVTIATSPQQGTLIANMTTDDHTTRTLLLSRKVPGMILVSRGSTSNIDDAAKDISSGHSQVKAFNISSAALTNIMDFNTQGTMLGWGLRNEVGIAEEPMTGAIYGVENSVDQMMRDDQNIHENNPGEELNFFGYLNDTSGENMGTNFGYPECYSAWMPDEIPNNDGIQVGTQFAIDDSGVDDAFCQNNRTQSRLVFQAHTAPLDIKFSSAGTNAWIAFHGSWNRDDPAGYNVGRVQFANGMPVDDVTSNTAMIPIVSNVDNSQCPDNCFRPVAMAWDSMGRLFFSSDETGEIYVVTTDKGMGVDDNSPAMSSPSGSPSGSPSSSGSAPEPSSTTGGASRTAGECVQWLLPAAAAAAAFLV